MLNARQFLLSCLGLLVWFPNSAQSAESGVMLANQYFCAENAAKPWRFGSSILMVSGDDVWMLGGWQGQKGGSLIRVTLPEMKAKDYPTDFTGTTTRVALGADGVYVLNKKREGLSKDPVTFLSRLDPITGTWENRPIQPAYDVYFAAGKIYLNLWSFASTGEENGLAQYDWASQKSLLLINTRRKPTLNQLDASSRSRVQQVFEALEKKTWVAVGSPLSAAFLVQEAEGEWTQEVALNSLFCHRGDNGVLLTGVDGKAVYVGIHEVVTWFDPAGPGEWGWKKPADWKTPWLAENTVALRSGELFILNRKEDGSYRLLCYWQGGPPEGLMIPLRFQLPATARQLIEMATPGKNPFSADAVAEPEKNPIALSPFASRLGLILKTPAHGFWFISNADLEAKKKEGLAKSREPLPGT